MRRGHSAFRRCAVGADLLGVLLLASDPRRRRLVVLHGEPAARVHPALILAAELAATVTGQADVADVHVARRDVKAIHDLRSGSWWGSSVHPVPGRWVQ